MKAVGGKLRFKGDGDVKKKRPREKEEAEAGPQPRADEPFEVKVVAGTGRVTSSGTTVYGFETIFTEQLTVGDALIVSHPTTLVDETKVVRMVLSNTSISISSSFTTDLVSTVPFRFAKAPPPPKSDLDREAQQKKERLNQLGDAGVGTYASAGGSTFTYRVRKEGAAGGYKIVTESTGGSVSKSELLDMRAKKKGDRHC